MKWNRVITGDCIEVMGKFPKDSVDLTVFSPPYDNLRAYDGEWEMDLNKMGQVLFDLTVDGGVCAMVIADSSKNYAKTLTTHRTILDWCDNVGWKLFELIVYNREGRPGPWFSYRFRVDHEYILIFFKGNKPKYFDKSNLSIRSRSANRKIAGTLRQTDGTLLPYKRGKMYETKCRGTIWFYDAKIDVQNEVKRKHPAVYPDALAKDLISCFSKENDRVLDPMCGSGTTCVMAAKMGRMYIGIDISEKYTKLAKSRLKNEASIEEIMYRKSGSKWSVSPLDGG